MKKMKLILIVSSCLFGMIKSSDSPFQSGGFVSSVTQQFLNASTTAQVGSVATVVGGLGLMGTYALGGEKIRDRFHTSGRMAAYVSGGALIGYFAGKGFFENKELSGLAGAASLAFLGYLITPTSNKKEIELDSKLRNLEAKVREFDDVDKKIEAVETRVKALEDPAYQQNNVLAQLLQTVTRSQSQNPQQFGQLAQ